jgi:type I restriction enzyme S subunit
MPATENINLKFVDFTQLINWSSYALLGKNLIYTQKYSFVRIGDFLKRNKEQVQIEDGVLYKRPTIRINGNGISLRDEVDGKNIGTKNQFRIYKDQFLLSKIDARNGAFGVVPKELNKGIITGNFWAFDVDYNIINPHYLALLTGTKEFQKLCQTASVGTTNRNYLQEGLFLNFEIPLPNLSKQESLLANYNSKIEKANILEEQASKLEGEIEKYFLEQLGIDERVNLEIKKGLNLIEYANFSKWSLNHINKDVYDFGATKFKTERLKSLLTFFEGGKTPSKSRADFWNGSIYWTSPKDFNGRIAIEKAEDRITELAVKEAGMKVYPKGIFLSVFRSGILQHSFPTAITEIETAINQDLKAYSLKEDLIDKKYYLYFVHTFKKYILSLASKKSVTVESINTEDFFEIPIPLPPIEIQNKISSNISNLIAKIKKSRLDAMQLNLEAKQQFEKSIFS